MTIEQLEKAVRGRLVCALSDKERLSKEFETAFVSEGMQAAQELGGALREAEGRVGELDWMLGEILLEREAS